MLRGSDLPTTETMIRHTDEGSTIRIEERGIWELVNFKMEETTLHKGGATLEHN